MGLQVAFQSCSEAGTRLAAFIDQNASAFCGTMVQRTFRSRGLGKGGVSPGWQVSLDISNHVFRKIAVKVEKLGDTRKTQRLKNLFHNDVWRNFSLFTLCK